jgi:hypothetical protein
LFTLSANVKGRVYIQGVPYELSFTAESSKEACLKPAPVIDENGKATHLYLQVASWDIVMAGLTSKSQTFHEESIAELLKTGMTVDQIKTSGPLCSGFTLQIGIFWYSIACFTTLASMLLLVDQTILIRHMVFNGNAEDVCSITIA